MRILTTAFKRLASTSSLQSIGSAGRLRLNADATPRALWLKSGNLQFLFENSLAIGSPRQIISSLAKLQVDKSLLRQVSLDKITHFLWRLSAGHFGYLSSNSITGIALGVRSDMVKFGTNTTQVDAYVIDCFQFTDPELIHVPMSLAIQFLKDSKASPKENTKIYNSLITLFGKMHRVDAAKELFTRMMSADMDLTDTFESILKSYALTNRLQEAEKIYSLMADKTSHSVILALMQAHALNGDIASTHKYFALIPALAPATLRSKAYSCLIQVYSERGLPGDTLRQYRKMRSEGLRVSSTCYEYMMRAHLQNTDVKSAIKWFHKKENVPEFRPSLGMYAALVEAYVAAGDVLGAWKTVKEAAGVFKGSRAHNARLHLPLAIFRPLVDDLRFGDGALKHLDYLRDRLDAVEFMPDVRGYIISRMMVVALETRKSKLPSTPSKSETSTATLSSTPKTSTSKPDHELVLALHHEFNTLAPGSYRPFHAYICAIESLGVSNLNEATKLFNTVIDESFEEEVDAYNALMRGYVLHNKKKEVLELFERMKRDGVANSVGTYESVLTVAPELSGVIAGKIDAEGVLGGEEHVNVKKCLEGNGYGLISRLLIH